jgi:hypothetical protein
MHSKAPDNPGNGDSPGTIAVQPGSITMSDTPAAASHAKMTTDPTTEPAAQPQTESNESETIQPETPIEPDPTASQDATPDTNDIGFSEPLGPGLADDSESEADTAAPESSAAEAPPDQQEQEPEPGARRAEPEDRWAMPTPRSTKDAETTPETAAPTHEPDRQQLRRPIRMLAGLLALFDRPFDHVSLQTKHLLGYVGIATLLTAVGTWAFVLSRL